MQAWIGLVGVLAGAVIAFAGQRLAYRSQVRDSHRLLVMEQCSQILALSENFRNRLWEERNGVPGSGTEAWDLPAYRLAEARLRLLSGSPALLSALAELDESGSAVGRLWRTAQAETPELDPALRAHRASIEAFVLASTHVLRRT